MNDGEHASPVKMITHAGEKQILIDALHKGVVGVEFIKANGKLRKMTCTLNQDLFDYEFEDRQKEIKNGELGDTITVWDLEVDTGYGWRKIRYDRISKVTYS